MAGKYLVVVVPDVHFGRKRKVIYQWDKLLRSNDKELVLGDRIAIRLQETVDWINKQTSFYDEILVVFIGDITESAIQEQFAAAKEILAQLDCFYITMAGNHDFWPYTRNGKGKVVWEDEEPLGFDRIERSLNTSNNNDWKTCFGVEEQGCLFQNYAFSWQGVRFVIVDKVNRSPSWFKFPGLLWFPKLHSESKRWLADQVEKASEHAIVIFSHAALSKRQLRWLSQLTTSRLINVAGHLHKWKIKERNGCLSLRVGALYLEPFVLAIEMTSEEINFDKCDIRIF